MRTISEYTSNRIQIRGILKQNREKLDSIDEYNHRNKEQMLVTAAIDCFRLAIALYPLQARQHCIAEGYDYSSSVKNFRRCSAF